MRSGLVMLILVAGCSGKEKGGQVIQVDASVDARRPVDASLIDAAVIDAPLIDAFVVDAFEVDAPTICSLLTQAGCAGGEKCTWIEDQDSPAIGHIGCAPAGVLAIGAACADPIGPSPGYDACVPGAVCVSSVCKALCDPEGGAPTCGTNHECKRYAEFFEIASITVAGVCDPRCDPLTQDVAFGSPVTACGSPDPSQPAKGCYGFDSFSCSPAGALNLTDRQVPSSNYLNACAPGFIPYFYTATGSTVSLCTGYCAALEVDNTPAHVGNAKGNPAALAKLPLSAAPLAGDGTCDIGKKGSDASSTCRFIWPYLEDGVTGQLPIGFETGPLLDTLGVCLAIGFFQYDSNNDAAADTAFPDCATLPVRSTLTTGDYDDAADWACQKRANSQFVAGPKTKNRALSDIRIGSSGPVPLVRHDLGESP